MTFRKTAAACALVPLGFALLGVLAWLTGALRLASLGASYIPMAPSTAIGFLLLGASQIALASLDRPAAHGAARAAALLVGALAILKLVEFFTQFPILNLEAALVARPGFFGAVPLARMSPVTAAALGAAAVGVACVAGPSSPRGRDIGGLFGALVLLAGVTVALGYAYGAPLLYGADVIPVALSTGLAFIGAGAALVAAAAPTGLPLRPLYAGSARARVLERLNRDLADRSAFALAAAGAGIWEADVRTAHIRCSDDIGPMLGRAAQAFEATPDELLALVHLDDRAMVESAITQAIESGASLRLECRLLRPNGEVRWLLAKGRISRLSSGEAASLLGIAMDVSERKVLEQQLQQAQKMESLGQLAGGIAHDFNNVLTAILGFCHVLLSDAQAGDRRVADLTEIKNAGESGQRLSRQLLAFSRRQPIAPSLVDINQVVSSSRGILDQLVGDRIVVEIALGSSLGSVYADAGQLQQVLVNLAVNARDAMPDGGRLRVETYVVRRSSLDARARPSPGGTPAVVLAVTDTGTGMPPDVVARIFEPFFTTKPPDKGTGLGLSTVYGIVRQTGGDIHVNSAVGVGTTFRVHLPRVEAVPQISAAG